MSDEESSGGWGKWVSIVLSIVALALSVTTYLDAETRRKKDVPFEVTAKSYEKYYEMNRIELEKPYLTHLFVTPDRYAGIKRTVVEAKGMISKKQRAQYLLEERAVADFIFTYYEQTLYQWEATKDAERKFTSEVLEYLRGRLLRNPRLIYWWREQNGGLETSYEERTRDDWQKNVLGKIDINKPEWCDALGPFADPASSRTGC